MENEEKVTGDSMKKNKSKIWIFVLAAVLAVMILAVIILSINTVYLKREHKYFTQFDTPSVSQKIEQDTSGSQNTAEDVSSTENASASAANASGTVSIEDSKDIAVKDAGVSQESLIYISAHEERNKNATYYDVEFADSSYEYEYKIDLNGNIISYEREPFKPKSNTQGITASDEYIGVEAAKNIALENCALTVNDITFTKETLERDNGVYVYEIEFKTATTKYEYDIDAVSGKILEQSTKAIKK